MSLERETVVIDHLDGTQEKVEDVTRQHIEGGVLYLFCRWSFDHREEHLGSWPLANIKKWAPQQT